jgi:hypothetical protein
VLLDTDDFDDATARAGSGNINQSIFRLFEVIFIGKNTYLVRSELKSNPYWKQARNSCCDGKSVEVIFLVRCDIGFWDEGKQRKRGCGGSLRDVNRHFPASPKGPVTRQVLTLLSLIAEP